MTARLPDVGYLGRAEPPAGVFLPKRNRSCASGLGLVVPFFGQDTAGIALRVLVLLGAQRPKERGQADTAEDQGNGNEIGEDFHRFTSIAMH